MEAQSRRKGHVKKEVRGGKETEGKDTEGRRSGRNRRGK
jgi:hypothetical protein